MRLNNIGASLGHGAWNKISATEGEKIQVVCLADELATRSIETVDLWKLDVEGYEIPALQGAEELLKQKRIKAIYAELTGKNGDQVREYLGDLGYSCHLIDSQNHLYQPDQLPGHTNGLFLPK